MQQAVGTESRKKRCEMISLTEPEFSKRYFEIILETTVTHQPVCQISPIFDNASILALVLRLGTLVNKNKIYQLK